VAKMAVASVTSRSVKADFVRRLLIWVSPS
jgi:hypothetical protein